MSGDFNLVEEEIDWCPSHPDDPELVTSFRDLKCHLELVDGWWNNNPDKLEYTYVQPSGNWSSSRIDRICLKQN